MTKKAEDNGVFCGDKRLPLFMLVWIPQILIFGRIVVGKHKQPKLAK